MLRFLRGAGSEAVAFLPVFCICFFYTTLKEHCKLFKMNGRTLLLSAFTLLFLCGCVNTSEKKDTNGTTEKRQVNVLDDHKSLMADTLITTYPIQIGNDKALITVKKILGNKPDHFLIDLDYRNEKAFSVYADKKALIDETKTPFFLDTVQRDYTQGATLTSVNYRAIRGSTLQFSAILKNEAQQKTVEGRFNVFYDPERRGTFYGWITDTIYHSASKK